MGKRRRDGFRIDERSEDLRISGGVDAGDDFGRMVGGKKRGVVVAAEIAYAIRHDGCVDGVGKCVVVDYGLVGGV